MLKLSKVRLTASYSKIAMKPSSPEISRLQMEAGYLQMLIQTGEKKSEMFVTYRVVKILQAADMEHHN